MEYTVKKLAVLSGVSVRTLHYYDQIGLLKPAWAASNGYRIYGRAEVDLLQQILFYRELGVGLEEIKRLLASSEYDRERALVDHLAALTQKKYRIEMLIHNVERTLQSMRGEGTMADHEKFEGFKQRLMEENEKAYGQELRSRYGEEAVATANAQVARMDRKQYEEGEALRAETESLLKAAVETGNPAGKLAQRCCELHKQWLCIYTPSYSKEYHMDLGEMYVADERFRTYYEKIVPGGATFLQKAINIFCGK